MIKLQMFQVDAFADRVFEGNPAAVCPLDRWLDDLTLQSIAEENNLSETAFFVPADESFELRWFTPVAEVDLCGHATLASAHVLYKHLGYERNSIRFLTKSGELIVSQSPDGLSMDFPAGVPKIVEPPPDLLAGLGKPPNEVLAANRYVAVYETEADIRSLAPDFGQLRLIDLQGVAVTAPGDDVDFVSRYFAPKVGINEDPVTGSAHCDLAPYWSTRLGRAVLNARQLSKRGGSIGCRVADDRVHLSGTAVDFMIAEIQISE